MGTVVRSPSIIVSTLSGISVASVHWSCQLLSFAIRMSLACSGRKKTIKGKACEIGAKSFSRHHGNRPDFAPPEAAEYKVVVAAALNGSDFLGALYLVVEGGGLVGEHAVFVHQEAEAPLLLQQSLFAAVGQEQLHVHLTAHQRLQALRTKK